MSNPNETIADIVAELRAYPFNWSEPSEIPGVAWCNEEVKEIADRIEAAEKRARGTADLRTIHALEMSDREHTAALTKAATQAVNMTNEKWERDLSCLAKIREALQAAGKAAREIQHVTEEANTAEVAISIAEICERTLLFKLFSRKFAKSPAKGGAK